MEKNLFSTEEVTTEQGAGEQIDTGRLSVPNYRKSPSTLIDHIVAFLIGFAAGFVVLFVFYKLTFLSLICGAIVGVIYIFIAEQGAIDKRIMALRVQFYDMLEAMSVAMRAGNPVLKALESARNDLSLIYSDDSDIIVELEIIITKFHNAVPLSAAFSDFAERCGLEDVASFASIYRTIEGKSSRADEIIRETQQIISDKMEIEMEIETMMTSAKSEVMIMLFMPLIILLVIGYAGGGFMDAIYTTSTGRIVSTGGLVIFFVSLLLSRKFSNVKI